MRGLFFLLSILGIVLLINVDLKAKPKPAVFSEPDMWHVADVEGLIAVYGSQLEEPRPTIACECKCNGTGKIKSADGLIEMDCPCLETNTCKSQNKGSLPPVISAEEALEPIAQVITELPETKQLPDPMEDGNPFAKASVKKKFLVVSLGAKSCGPCVQMHNSEFPRLTSMLWEFSNGSWLKHKISDKLDDNPTILEVDIYGDTMKDLASFLGIDEDEIFEVVNAIPMIIKVDLENKKIVEKLVGYQSAGQIHYFYNHKQEQDD